MEIVYFGHSCFWLKTQEAGVLMDPFADKIGMRLPKVAPDIVCCSHQHSGHNDVSQISNSAFIISAPGEYEIKNVSITGLAAWHDGVDGKDRGRNTVYIVEAEGWRLCHLGDIGHLLSDKECDLINSVDVLMIPVGGETTIDAKQAAAVVAQLEPRLVLPMHFKTNKTAEYAKAKTPIEDFLQEMNGTRVRHEKKLKLSSIAAVESEMEIVILERKE
ncbi:MBL fold metallo-hydrolase [Patescibacteria group bacterium]|nr:MBL fold metallo-hydrolase [Patescibacteria group bacterium]MBU1931687.1 MBL fold metallo-hydrolase [Patescibacteria group bacterium]